MPSDHILAGALLAYATLERLFELVLARRNTRALLAEGAYEVGRGHYPLLVGLHVLWLLILWTLLGAGEARLVPAAAVGYGLVQALRLWTVWSLGRYWTTRILVVPHAPLVRRGPYRFLRHPNYLVVVLEIALLPLALGSWPLAWHSRSPMLVRCFGASGWRKRRWHPAADALDGLLINSAQSGGYRKPDSISHHVLQPARTSAAWHRSRRG